MILIQQQWKVVRVRGFTASLAEAAPAGLSTAGSGFTPAPGSRRSPGHAHGTVHCLFRRDLPGGGEVRAGLVASGDHEIGLPHRHAPVQGCGVVPPHGLVSESRHGGRRVVLRFPFQIGSGGGLSPVAETVSAADEGHTHARRHPGRILRGRPPALGAVPPRSALGVYGSVEVGHVPLDQLVKDSALFDEGARWGLRIVPAGTAQPDEEADSSAPQQHEDEYCADQHSHRAAASAAARLLMEGGGPAGGRRLDHGLPFTCPEIDALPLPPSQRYSLVRTGGLAEEPDP